MTFTSKKKDRPHKISLFSDEERAIISKGYSQNISLGKKLEQLYKLLFTEMGAEVTPIKINEDIFLTFNGQSYLIEMKTRDDHDSSAIKGHVDTFLKKIRQVPEGTICFFYFVDEERKNRKFFEDYFEVLAAAEITKYFPAFPYEEIVGYFARYRNGERE